MVRNIILSRYRAGPYPWDTGIRKISKGPLYPVNQVLALLQEHKEQAIWAWTNDSLTDVQALDLEMGGLMELVTTALTTGRYHRSEWCQRHKNGPWAACDAYLFKREEWFPKANKFLVCDYYIKLAISKSSTLLLLVSCHPSV